MDGIPSHEPAGYRCPFCLLASGNATDLTSQEDVVTRTDRALVVISPRWWPKNQGHAIVVPTAHFENLYTIPPDFGHAVHDLVQQIAIAMRMTYGCEGISTRQHNEPAGYQDVWHHHVHVLPRYQGDKLYQQDPLPGFATAEQRRPYLERLQTGLARLADR